jgi:uncharacterized lipoprotein YddW (UPF0748 family)
VQIRSAGDAMYLTNLAPWSKYRKARFSSPSHFMILRLDDYKRMIVALSFHAWLNPYRATMDMNTALLSPNHDVNLHPEWMIKYGGTNIIITALPEYKLI